MYVCMYVCPKIYIRRALSENVTVAPLSKQQQEQEQERCHLYSASYSRVWRDCFI